MKNTEKLSVLKKRWNASLFIVAILSLFLNYIHAEVVFPLKKSSNGRYLEDANGTPFLIKNMASWGLIRMLSEADAGLYMDTIKAKGFNTMLIMLTCKHKLIGANDPKWTAPNGTKIGPYGNDLDFSTVNPAFFDHAARVVQLAQDRGMLVLLIPSYAGAENDAKQGWWDELQSSKNSLTVCNNYGKFVGNRFKGFKNIVWVAGGDNRCAGVNPTTGTNFDYLGKKQIEMIKGIKSVAPNQMWTAHVKSPINWPSESVFKAYMDLDGFYNTRESAMPASHRPMYKSEINKYQTGPLKVLFQLDQAYELDVQVPDTQDYQFIRRKNYDSILSGCSGTCFLPGKDPGHMAWYFQNGGIGDWKTLIGTGGGSGTKGMQEAKHCFSLYSSVDWQNLVPDSGSALVTAGRGTYGDVNYVCAAKTADGKLGIVYVPTTRTITVAMSKLAGPNITARWYDPTAGTYKSITGSPFASGTGAGAKTFSTPGNHSDGKNDWVLVFN